MVEPDRISAKEKYSHDAPQELVESGIAESRASTFSAPFSNYGVVQRGDSDKVRYVGEGTPESPYIVDWGDCDPENPFNWKKKRKWPLTFLVRTSAFGTTQP